MGTGLQNFTSFWNTTNVRVLTPADTIHNEICAQDYSLAWFLRGKKNTEVIQNGSKIKDFVLLEDQATAVEYLPNDTFSWSSPQNTLSYEADWRYVMDHSSTNEQEIEFQTGSGQDGVKVAFKKLAKIKRQSTLTSMLNKLESQLWSAPMSIQSSYEGATGATKPYSIPCFVNEESAYLPYGWSSTIMGLNPTTYSKWRNVRNQYDYNDWNDVDGDQDGIFDIFTKTIKQIQFKKPPSVGPEGSPTSEGGSECVIFTDLPGAMLIEKANRENNSQFQGNGSDAYRGDAQFANWKVIYVPQLDNAALYNNGSNTYVAQASAQYPGPRFYFINTEYLRPFWHTNAYFKKLPAIVPSNQPESSIMPMRCWWNLFCRSRSRQAIVYPGA